MNLEKNTIFNEHPVNDDTVQNECGLVFQRIAKFVDSFFEHLACFFIITGLYRIIDIYAGKVCLPSMDLGSKCPDLTF